MPNLVLKLSTTNSCTLDMHIPLHSAGAGGAKMLNTTSSGRSPAVLPPVNRTHKDAKYSRAGDDCIETKSGIVVKGSGPKQASSNTTDCQPQKRPVTKCYTQQTNKVNEIKTDEKNVAKCVPVLVKDSSGSPGQNKPVGLAALKFEATKSGEGGSPPSGYGVPLLSLEPLVGRLLSPSSPEDMSKAMKSDETAGGLVSRMPPETTVSKGLTSTDVVADLLDFKSRGVAQANRKPVNPARVNTDCDRADAALDSRRQCPDTLRQLQLEGQLPHLLHPASPGVNETMESTNCASDRPRSNIARGGVAPRPPKTGTDEPRKSGKRRSSQAKTNAKKTATASVQKKGKSPKRRKKKTHSKPLDEDETESESSRKSARSRQVVSGLHSTRSQRDRVMDSLRKIHYAIPQRSPDQKDAKAKGRRRE